MQALGVTDHRFLGGAGRWRDSGMMGTPGNDDPRAFWSCAKDEARFDEAVAQAVAVIREVRPQVLVTYDENGGYGHPGPHHGPPGGDGRRRRARRSPVATASRGRSRRSTGRRCRSRCCSAGSTR